ncbi:MAG: hypothetical protein GY778_10590 [bacterium]|nr:hypothetical protein [bacterium]
MAKKRERRKQERVRRTKLVRSNAAKADQTAGQQTIDQAARKSERLAARYLRSPDLPDRVEHLAREVRELALTVIGQSPQHSRHECVSGCACCCHTAVTVAPPETLAIARYLVEHHTADELQQIRRRMDENAELASKLSRDEYIARLIPCALMTDDGNCRAHPVRPITCAGFCSTSRAACEAEFNRSPGRGSVPTDRFAMAAGLAVSNGLLNACRNADRDGRFYELHHALRRVLDTPDAARQWATGQDVFRDCLT